MTSSMNNLALKKYKKNLNSVLLLDFFWSFLLMQAVAVPFFLWRHLTLSEILWLQVVQAGVMLICQLPVSYLSDITSRRAILIIAALLRTLGGILFTFADSFFDFVGVYIIIGIGNSLFTSTDIALLIESSQKLTDDHTTISQHLSRRYYYMKMGGIIAAICGGILAAISFKYLLIVNMLCAPIALIITFKLKDIERVKLQNGHLKNIKISIRLLVRQSKLFLLILIYGIIFSMPTVLALYTSQALWQQAGIPLIYFGYIVGGSSLLGIVFALYLKRLQAFVWNKYLFLIASLLPALAFFQFASTLIILMISANIALELGAVGYEIIFKKMLNQESDAKIRAIANSVVLMGNFIALLVMGPSLGTLLETYGFTRIFSAIGLFFLVAFAMVAYPLMRSYQQKELTSDCHKRTVVKNACSQSE